MGTGGGPLVKRDTDSWLNLEGQREHVDESRVMCGLSPDQRTRRTRDVCATLGTQTTGGPCPGAPQNTALVCSVAGTPWALNREMSCARLGRSERQGFSPSFLPNTDEAFIKCRDLSQASPALKELRGQGLPISQHLQMCWDQGKLRKNLAGRG